MKKSSLSKVSRVLDGGGLTICLFLLLIKRINAFRVYPPVASSSIGIRWDVVFYQFLRECLRSKNSLITPNILKFSLSLGGLVNSLETTGEFNKTLLNFFSTFVLNPSNNVVLVKSLTGLRSPVNIAPLVTSFRGLNFKASFAKPCGGFRGLDSIIAPFNCKNQFYGGTRSSLFIGGRGFNSRFNFREITRHSNHYRLSKYTSMLRYAGSIQVRSLPKTNLKSSHTHSFIQWVYSYFRSGVVMSNILRLRRRRLSRRNKRRLVRKFKFRARYFWRFSTVLAAWGLLSSPKFVFRTPNLRVSYVDSRVLKYPIKFIRFFKPSLYSVKRVSLLKVRAGLPVKLRRVFLKARLVRLKSYRKGRRKKFFKRIKIRSMVKKQGFSTNEMSLRSFLFNAYSENSITISNQENKIFSNRILITQSKKVVPVSFLIRHFSTATALTFGEFLTSSGVESEPLPGGLTEWVSSAGALNLPTTPSTVGSSVVKQGYFLRRGAVGLNWSPAFGIGFSYRFWGGRPTKLIVPGVTATVMGGLRSERILCLASKLIEQTFPGDTRVNRTVGGSVLLFTNSFFFKRSVKWRVLQRRRVFLPKVRLMYYTLKRNFRRRFSFRNTRVRRFVKPTFGLPPRAKLRRKKLRYHTFVTSCLKEVMFSKRRLTSRLVFLKRNLYLIRTSKRLLSQFFFKKRHVPSWFFWLKRKRFHFYWKLFRKRKPQKSRQARTNIRRQLRVFKPMWRNWSVTKQTLAYTSLFFNVAHKPTIVSYWYRRTLRRRRRFKGFSQKIRRLYRRMSVRLVSSGWLRGNGFTRLSGGETRSDFFSTQYVPWLEARFAWTGLFFARGLLRFKFGKSGRRLLTLRPISAVVPQNKSLVRINFSL